MIILIHFVALAVFYVFFADDLLLDFHGWGLNFNRKSIKLRLI